MSLLHSTPDVPKCHYVKYYDIQLQDEYLKIIGPWNTTIRRLYKELKENKDCKFLKKILWKMYQLRGYTVIALSFEAVDTDFAKKDLPSEEKIIAICKPYSQK